MDTLYIDKQSSEELKYSLRSIEKFGKGLDRLIICSSKPISWLNNENDRLSTIIVPDVTKNRDKNILNCMLECSKRIKDLSDDFIYQSDDHLYIKETDFRKRHHYIKGTLPDKDNENDIWRHFLYRTDVWLDKVGCGLKYNMSQHCGTLMNKMIILDNEINIKKIIKEEKYGAEVMSFLMNQYLEQHNKEIIKYRKDCKFLLGDEWNLEDKNECISMDDNFFIDRGKMELDKMFPEKCCFEK